MIGGGYVYLAGAVAVLVAVGSAYWQGRTDGATATRAEYQARDLQAATETRIAERGIQDRYRAQEAKWAQSFAAVSKKYQKELAANETRYLTSLATAPVLRDPYAADCKAGGSSAAEAAPSPGKRDGGKGSQLSPEASIFLWNLAVEADAVVLQLTACQAVIAEDRK